MAADTRGRRAPGFPARHGRPALRQSGVAHTHRIGLSDCKLRSRPALAVFWRMRSRAVDCRPRHYRSRGTYAPRRRIGARRWRERELARTPCRRARGADQDHPRGCFAGREPLHQGWEFAMTIVLAASVRQNGLTAVRPRGVHDAEAIAAIAARCLLDELETWPKPGLVSHVDAGSHSDMDAGTFRCSAAAIQPYFHALAEPGAHGRGMTSLTHI